ncbi:MAG: CPBP family intramembrane metalloprotease, partial [Planctomycetales bacterium]|nr:CPBP family intramembrane metalloprotease [Planctomycetales bacterium]
RGRLFVFLALGEGQYTDAIVFTPPVLAVTAGGCLLAIRWAVDQFNNESVLFRDSERWDLGIWVRHVVRDRGDVPTFAEGILCGVVLLLIRFFAQTSILPPNDWRGIAVTTLVLQIGLIATPALLMAIVLTRRPWRTLRLTTVRPASLVVGPLLALALHPTVMSLSHAIQTLYPMSGETMEALKPFLAAVESAPLWSVLLVIAVTPAICEELAFRGFVLSGLQSTGRKWTAILISSFFFGVMHSVLQQQLSAFLVGIIIGYLAAQTRSLWPCVLFHVTHNSLGVLVGQLTPNVADQQPLWRWLFHSIGEDGFGYHWPWLIESLVVSCALLGWLRWRANREPAANFVRGSEAKMSAVI